MSESCNTNKFSTKLPLILFITISTLTLACIIVATIVMICQSGTSNIIDSCLFISLLIFYILNIYIGFYTFRWGNSCLYFISSLESVHMLSTTVLIGFWLFCRSYNGECTVSNDYFYTYWSCNPQFSTDTLPVDSMLVLMLTPFVYSAIYENKVTWQVLVSTWLIVVSWILICILVFQARNSIFSLVFYSILSFFTLFQTKFLSIKSHAEVIHRDNEIKRIESEVEASTKEMQNMVSNVTHDLKSPLSVVTASVTSVKDAISNSRKSFKSGQATVQSLMENVNSIENSMKHVSVMNIFMVESINRVLDCSKLRTGMKLVPKKETLNINEALELPITCMSVSQDRIGIELLPIGTDISSHIITDKQWFQENMICLLSNAVKYSSRGTVTISLSLVKLADLPYASVARGNAIKAKEQQESHTDSAENQKNSISNENSLSITPRIASPVRRQSSIMKFIFSVLSRPVSRLFSNKIGPLLDETNTSNNDNASNDSASVSIRNSKNPNDLESGVLHSVAIPENDVLSNKTSVDMINSNKSNLRRRKTFNDLMTNTSNVNSTSGSSMISDMFLLIEVQDTGIGISQEVMDNLFSPFKQAQSFAGGTGLGLYSLAKRSDALGGYYGVRARNDGVQGSVFWFAIPYKPDRINTKIHNRRIEKAKSIMCLTDISANNTENTSSIKASKTYPNLDDHVFLKSSNEATSMSSVNQGGLNCLLHTSQHIDDCTNIDRSKCSSSCNIPEEKNEDDVEAEEEKFGHHFTICGEISSYHDKYSSEESKGSNLINFDDDDINSKLESEVVLPLAPLNILLVDDSFPILKLTGKMLRNHSHTVTEARDGEECLCKLEEVRNDQTKTMKPYDVVIIDLHMPVMDGLESTKRLRKIENELLIRNSVTTATTTTTINVNVDVDDKITCNNTASFDNNGKAIIKNPDSRTGSSNRSNVNMTTNLNQNQLIILCSANNDAATAKLAFEAGCDYILEKPLSVAKFHRIYNQLISGTK